jgi:hypothetical protein
LDFPLDNERQTMISIHLMLKNQVPKLITVPLGGTVTNLCDVTAQVFRLKAEG